MSSTSADYLRESGQCQAKLDTGTNRAEQPVVQSYDASLKHKENYNDRKKTLLSQSNTIVK